MQRRPVIHEVTKLGLDHKQSHNHEALARARQAENAPVIEVMQPEEPVAHAIVVPSPVEEVVQPTVPEAPTPIEEETPEEPASVEDVDDVPAPELEEENAEVDAPADVEEEEDETEETVAEDGPEPTE